MKQSILIFVVSILATGLSAGQNDILGTWSDEDQDAKIEMYVCGTKYCGKIVWLKEPTYPAGSKEGRPNMPILDHNNPDPDKRQYPLLGLRILYNFELTGDNVWNDGKIYDPDSGKTFNGKIRLLSPHQLELRGFMGVSVFGSTTIWTK
jgi:uncharacterized protein (DUF2147 family)